MSFRPYLPILQRFNLWFADPKLLFAAFTHRSFYSDSHGGVGDGHYERLEYIGDAVLDLVYREYVMEEFPEAQEGFATSLKERFVKNESLAAISDELGLISLLRASKASREHLLLSRNIKADLFEAFLGVVYKDRNLGLPAVRRILEQVLFPKIAAAVQAVSDPKELISPKTALNNAIARKYRQAMRLEYVVIGQEPDGSRCVVEVRRDGVALGIGTGTHKKKAEVAAAEDALRKLAV